jgi:hypothetical protein
VSAAPPAGRAGAALGIGALAGVLAAVPALVRLSSSGAGGSIAVLVLSGGAALVLGPLLVLLDRARTAGARLSVVFVGLGLAAWPLSFLGSVLERTTHHRPLGAATFALLSLAVVLGCLLVARRVTTFDAASTAGRALRVVLALCAAASTALVLLTGLRDEGVRPHVLDGALLVVFVALGWAALLRPVLVSALSRVGLVLWIAFVAGHLAALTRPSFQQIREGAPVLAGPFAWL